MNHVFDFHSHILPEMDDGSDNVETTVKLLRMLSEQGVTRVCATSHYYRKCGQIEDYLSCRAAACRKLEAAWNSSFPQLLLGAEVAFFSEMSEESELSSLCFERTRTLLLEMPFTEWTPIVVEEVMHLALDCDFHIVLAHPERYLYARENVRHLEQFAQAGIGFQVNADALLRWNTRKIGLQLLQMTRFPALGSDSHNLANRAPHIGKARAYITKKLGESFLCELDSSMNELLCPQKSEVRI